MSDPLATMKTCVATIEDRVAVMKLNIARLEEVNDAQTLAFDRNSWQRAVGVLLTLIEAHGDHALVTAAVRIINTNPHTGSLSSEPRADIARMNVETTIAQAIAAGIVIPAPESLTNSLDLTEAIRVLETDVDLDPDTSDAEAAALHTVVRYALLGAKSLAAAD